MDDWKKTIVSPDTPLKDTISKINSVGVQFGLVLHNDGKLAGTVSDGDIRRAILREESLQTPISKVMKKNPITELVTLSGTGFSL